MKFLLSLDYELFFGTVVGSVERCLIEPTEALIGALAPAGVKATFFVDATYLVALAREGMRHPSLQRDLDAVRAHLAHLVSRGHDVQLHVHPHWEDSTFDGTRWMISTKRYRLHDFDPQEQERIVADAQAALEEIAGRPVFAFRAGGWCLQPFDKIAGALRKSGIWLESTVFPGGRSTDSNRSFDFRAAPNQTHWRFSDDPCRADERGDFVEVPISSFRASPPLFWRMAMAKKIDRKRHRAFGDGSAIRYGAAYYVRRLLLPSWSVVSVDGMKVGALAAAGRQWRRRSRSDLFHVMGHPKALTRFSLEKFTAFLRDVRNLEPVTLSDFRHLRPAA